MLASRRRAESPRDVRKWISVEPQLGQAVEGSLKTKLRLGGSDPDHPPAGSGTGDFQLDPAQMRSEGWVAMCSSAGFRGHHTDLQHSDTLLHSTAGNERRPCRSRATDADSSGQITRAIRGKMRSFNRRGTNRTLQSERATEFSILQSVPKVGLEPTPSCEDRILSPARLPSAWYWADVGLTLISGIFQGFTMAPVFVRIVVALG